MSSNVVRFNEIKKIFQRKDCSVLVVVTPVVTKQGREIK
jgi:hypothetical protein